MNRIKVQLFLLERWVWIIAIVVFISFFGPSITDLTRIFRMYAAYGVLAIAVGISLICGSTDASSPAIGGFAGAFVVEFGEIWFPGASPILLLLLPLIIGAVVGAVNGLIVSRTGVHSFFVTLATFLIFIGVRKLIREGTLWVRHSDALLLLGKEIVGGLDFSIVLLFFVTFLMWLLLNYTRIGVRLYAIGGDATSARLMGINVENMRLFVHTLVGAMAGLSGLIYVADVGATSPEMMDLWLFWIFAMVIFGGIALGGGRGNIENVIAGMFFISSLDIGARGLGIPVHLIHFIIGALILLGIIVNLIVDKLRDRLLMPSH
ncbi:MAG: ABC transporter permease [Nitrososphaerota archaeon]|nr:ABC transporter permease [Candidatus Bathyarchaeota archaeon]MDW8022905.1 ABC transporter permease [Nitrososphaerota archaeon]